MDLVTLLTLLYAWYFGLILKMTYFSDEFESGSPLQTTLSSSTTEVMCASYIPSATMGQQSNDQQQHSRKRCRIDSGDTPRGGNVRSLGTSQKQK